MKELPCQLDWVRTDELQWKIDSRFMKYITEMTRYVLNPDNKLPPKLKENNSGYTFVTNINDLATDVDFEKGIINTNIEESIKCYKKIQECFSDHYNPDNNLTYYPINLIKSSNSSKFIHGLPYGKILWEKRTEFEKNPDKLKEYIESFREKLHIDKNVEIVSAKIRNDRIQLRMKIGDKHDVTMAIGYPTKQEVRYNEDWEAIDVFDSNGNLFSPQWVNDVIYNISDEKIKQLADNANKNWAEFMMNFFAWRAPEYVTEENYKHYYYEEVGENISDTDDVNDNAMRDGYVLHRFSNNKLVRIKLVWWDNNLAYTQDQIMPNYWNTNWNKEEKENFNYWKKTYQKNLNFLIDKGVSKFRIDLAHGFGKGNDFNLFKDIIKDGIKYAKSKKNKKISFTLETYDFSYFEWGTEPANFRDWNNDLDLTYPAIKVYHKNTEDYLLNLHSPDWLNELMNNFRWLLQDIRASHGEMMTAASYDDYPLFEIAEKAWIQHKYILEFQILLGKAGYNIFSLDRDFLWHRWELNPSVPGGKAVEGVQWKFETHKHIDGDEFLNKIKKDTKTIFYESEWIKILKKLKNRSKLTWISIVYNKVIFNFESWRRRIFDFESLMNWWKPYTEYTKENPEVLSNNDMFFLKTLNKTKKQLKKKSKKNNTYTKQPLPHVYNHSFWTNFVTYINNQAEIDLKEEIPGWDKWKQEAYFQLNRNKLVNDYLKLKEIISPDEEEYRLSNEMSNLMIEWQNKVNIILNKYIWKIYPDLVV